MHHKSWINAVHVLDSEDYNQKKHQKYKTLEVFNDMDLLEEHKNQCGIWETLVHCYNSNVGQLIFFYCN